ncbi:MAG: CRISPR-associated protein Cas4 [Halobacteriota archaeon]|nr:CRISPR-associated protein Cas4 [Halobacteriota archaeon]
MAVKVSEISMYLLCPRQVYYTAKGHEMMGDTERFLERVLLKELSFFISQEGVDCRTWNLEEILTNLTERIRLIYKDELKDICDEKLDEVKSRLLSEIDLSGLEVLKSFRTEREVREVDHLMSSERLGLVGSVDCLLSTDGEYFPLMIKTGRSPDAGVWKSDRLQLTSYVLLIEEAFDTVVRKGYVEYIREQDIREAEIKPQDRRKVLTIADRIRRIKEGKLPDKIANKKICEGCSFFETCSVEKSLFSKFF